MFYSMNQSVKSANGLVIPRSTKTSGDGSNLGVIAVCAEPEIDESA
jgi:hypothetical protein